MVALKEAARSRPPAVGWMRGDQGLLVIAVVAAVAPIVVAAVRGPARGWLPTGDDAYTAVRGWDVFGGPVPLLGTWSSASQWAELQINHPGPLQFDVAAIPVWLFGPGWGVALATAGVNVASVLVVAWLVRRLLGDRAAVVAMLLVAGWGWAMGSELLYDPWSQHAPLFPFLALLFAAWATASGEDVALPVVAVTGSYALQTHLSYTLLVPVLVAWAAVGWALAVRRRHRVAGDGDRDRRHPVRWAIAGVVALVVCWVQPLLEQFTEEPGNIGQLMEAGGSAPGGPGPEGAARAVGYLVGLPSFWWPPWWISAPFERPGAPLWLLVLVLLVVASAGGALAVLAGRAGDRTVVTGLATAAVAVAVGFATAARSTSGFGLVSTYLRWLWPISVFAWTVLALAAGRVLRARVGPGWWQRRTRPLGAVTAALAVLVAVLTLPSADRGSAAPVWAMDTTREVSRQMMPHLEGQGPVLVRLPLSDASSAVGPALFFELQRHGIEFVVEDPNLVSQLGPSREFEPGDALTAITVVGGGAATETPPGSRRIAYVPGLDSEERRELEAVTRAVEARLPSLDGLALDEEQVDSLPYPLQVVSEPTARRAEAGDLRALAELVDWDVLRSDSFPDIDMGRWAELFVQDRYQSVAVLMELLPAS